MTNLKSEFLLDPDVIFLNHGSFGACPRRVFEVYQSWQRRLESQPVLFLGREMSALDRGARHVLGADLHTAADNLVFVTNATHGVNIVARSLPLKAGDQILTTDHEYGACDYTWEFICQKTGANYVRQPIPLPVQSDTQIVDALWQAVTPRTRCIYLSHITSPTALRFPVQAISARARQHGILTVVDGAHAPGQMPIDLTTIGADFYTGNCHKWMCSPKGAAFLFAREEVQPLLEPLIVSWGYHAMPETTTGSRFIDLLSWTGTRDPAASLSVPAAIEFMHDHNWDNVRSECHRLLQRAIELVCQLTQMPPLYPLDSDFYAQMGIAPLPPTTNTDKLKRLIYTEHRIEVPIIQWNGQVFIRISVQGYNQATDIDALITALSQLLPVCQEARS